MHHPFIKRATLLLCLLLLLLSPAMVQAQLPDSLPAYQHSQKSWHQTRAVQLMSVPISLSLLALPTVLSEQHTSFSKYGIQQEIQEAGLGVQTRIDDPLRYAPAAMVYGLNMLGVQGKNGFAERSILLAKSLLIQHVLVTGMKNGLQIERPGGGGLSFPSSHAARAFATATFMHREYGHLSAWYSVAAYSMATATATLRVTNNHHWLPDVLVGAGIGILSTNLAYATHQYRWSKWRAKRQQQRSLVMLPAYNGRGPGLYVQLQF